MYHASACQSFSACTPLWRLRMQRNAVYIMIYWPQDFVPACRTWCRVNMERFFNVSYDFKSVVATRTIPGAREWSRDQITTSKTKQINKQRAAQDYRYKMFRTRCALVTRRDDVTGRRLIACLVLWCRRSRQFRVPSKAVCSGRVSDGNCGLVSVVSHVYDWRVGGGDWLTADRPFAGRDLYPCA